MATRPIELSLVSYKILARLILMGILVSPDGRRTSSSKGSGWKQRKLCYRTLIVVVVTKIVIRATQPCSMMKDIANIPCELRVQHRAILLLFAARLCIRFHLSWFASPISMRDNIPFLLFTCTIFPLWETLPDRFSQLNMDGKVITNSRGRLSHPNIAAIKPSIVLIDTKCGHRGWFVDSLGFVMAL